MAKSKFSKKQIAGVLLLSSTAVGATASGTASANSFTNFLKNAKNGLGNLVNEAGTYAVSGIDKAGEILKSGVNKIGDKVAGSKFSEYTGKIFGYTSDKVSTAYNELKGSTAGEWVKNSKVGKFIGNNKNTAYKHAWGAVAVGLLLVLVYGTYKAIKKVNHYYKYRHLIAFINSKNKVLKKIEELTEILSPDNNKESINKAISTAKKLSNNLNDVDKALNYDVFSDIKSIQEDIFNTKMILSEGTIPKLNELYQSYEDFSKKKENLLNKLNKNNNLWLV